MSTRERRAWTEKEDQLLRDAVAKEDPGTPSPSRWHLIAQHIPSRTNKDCRKRWFSRMSGNTLKGGWAPDEDTRLIEAITQCGTRWSVVSAKVRTRNSDQCAKRWADTLNPAIDRTPWTPEEDSLLTSAVNDHGKRWSMIVRKYLPGRTGLNAKNRYNSITRFMTRPSRSPSGSSSSSVPLEGPTLDRVVSYQLSPSDLEEMSPFTTGTTFDFSPVLPTQSTFLHDTLITSPPLVNDGYGFGYEIQSASLHWLP